MLNNKLNSTLVKTFIKFDLLFLNSLNFENIDKNKNVIKLLNRKELNYSLIDISEIFKNIKQILRIFQFSYKRNDSILQFQFKSSYFSELFNCLLHFFIKDSKTKIFASYTRFSFVLKKKNIFFLIGMKKEKSLYSTLLSKNVFISTLINSYFEKIDLGFYKLFGNLNKTTKIVFFFLLLKNVFNNKQNKKK